MGSVGIRVPPLCLPPLTQRDITGPRHPSWTTSTSFGEGCCVLTGPLGRMLLSDSYTSFVFFLSMPPLVSERSRPASLMLKTSSLGEAPHPQGSAGPFWSFRRFLRHWSWKARPRPAQACQAPQFHLPGEVCQSSFYLALRSRTTHRDRLNGRPSLASPKSTSKRIQPSMSLAGNRLNR